MVCIAAFLPLPLESLGSLFLLTLVTPKCVGRIPQKEVLGECWEGWDRSWGSSSPHCPKLGKRLAGHTGRWGWVNSNLVPSPSLGEVGCHLEVSTRGRLPWQHAAWQSLSL